jgi:tetratricopeptide (TPR) repeat protein
MSIIIICPKCQCKMSVPDSLAGKHGKCSKCKSPVIVPGGSNGTAVAPSKPMDQAPSAPPAPSIPAPAGTGARPAPPAAASAPAEPPADLEAEAMSVLADEPAETSAKAGNAIEFECPMCFEPVKVGLDLGGKKHPCPSCKRIITVPMPKVEARASWRDTGPNLPSAARRDEQPELEGAWGSTKKTGPSHEALQEAGVIKEREKPKTLLQKLAPYVIVGVPLLLLGGGGWGVWNWLASGKEKEAYTFAIKFADDAKSRAAVGTDGLAGLHAGAAVYHLHTDRAKCAAEARDEILKAVLLAGAAHDGEGDALLLDLAALTLDLAGSDEEIAHEKRLKWDDVQKALGAVLAGIQAPAARLEALRRVSAVLVQRGQLARVLPLTTQLHATPGPERSEALAVVGLELLSLGKKEEAIKAAERAEEVFAKKNNRPVLRPAIVALAVSLNRKLPLPAKKGSDDEEALQLGRALALGREGKLPEAQAAIQKATALRHDQVRASYNTIVAAIENKQAGKAAFEAILPDCGAIAQKEPWVVLLLVDAALRADVPVEGVEPAVAALPGAFAGWGQLLILRARLKASRSVEPATVLEKFPANTLGGRMARLELSRHNMRRSSDWYNTVKEWETPDRAFGSLGVALGMQKR